MASGPSFARGRCEASCSDLLRTAVEERRASDDVLTDKDSASNQDTWEGDNVDVTAFYDDDGKVRQLDDSTGESKLPCARTRQ